MRLCGVWAVSMSDDNAGSPGPSAMNLGVSALSSVLIVPRRDGDHYSSS